MNSETLTPTRTKSAASTAVAPGSTALMDLGRTGRAAADTRKGPEDGLYFLSRHYLGGKKFSKRSLSSRSEVHAAIVSGASYGALLHFISQMNGLLEADIAKVLGLSTRTLRRQSEYPDKPMPADLASKAWLFAETLAKATDVFGGKEAAEAWVSKTAMGLDGQRPIDLLQTVQGAELVNDFLTRLQYGVYS